MLFRSQRRTQEERRADTSGRLLKATIDLLLQKGYSGFRIADAAAKAKVTRGGQTHHFATKNDLIEAAIDNLFVNEVSQAQVDAAGSADCEILSHAARHAQQFLTSKLFQVSFKMLISLRRREDLADRVRAISARSRAPIEQAWTGRMVQAGIDPKDAEAVLGLLWSVQRSIVIETLIGGDPGGVGEGELEFTVDLLNDYLEKRKQEHVAA